ncbi:SET domain-containing protein [Gonapodya prolifera JEL478]|uniref:SET domain-containing protein n=1 Tax=Gonapodya prolifera (strain JEL478) TaxID=1344416 RepID=A0A139AE09_GONPJ|nr:SET domain-containing protein [Gonapodya prolifera JEL478]|eukprot:KXS14824.1 SET domain-containing protein [Gonapodya prolifera JEL478]
MKRRRENSLEEQECRQVESVKRWGESRKADDRDPSSRSVPHEDDELVTIDDISQGLERIAVPARFFRSDVSRLSEFKYVVHSVIPSKDTTRTVKAESYYPGCTCRDGCPVTEDKNVDDGCSCGDSRGYPYVISTTTGNNIFHNNHLRQPTSSPPPSPIYECNATCTCPPSCQRRVVQYGVAARLEVRSMPHKGMGVVAMEDIERGRFVCEYAGEILGKVQRDEVWRKIRVARIKAASTSDVSSTDTEVYDPAMHNYALTVLEHAGETVYRTTVDAQWVSNVGRFVNHSCEPNTAMVTVRWNSPVPAVALVSLGIATGQEVTFGYWGLDGRREKAGVGSSQEGNEGADEDGLLRIRCLCGAKSCRGYLPTGDW